LVLFWGTSARGTVGWIGLGFFNIQPVEIAKLSLIIFLASFISKKKSELGGMVRLAVSLILTSVMIFLVIKQPDLGSAMILSGIWLGMMLVSGINKKHFLFLFIFLLIVSTVSWFFLADYQKDRINNLFNPELDPRGSGYNAIQSVVAVGSGGIAGKGLSHGSQSQLNFLPEKHTDFIFAVITEEMGLIGAIFILALYLVLLFRIRKIAQNCSENFGYLVTSGIMIMLFMQVFINIGMNIKIMPVTGITLPLLSYGGSSMIVVLAALGIVLNINLRNSSGYSNPGLSG
jgi:rod shape determining protein RodA